MTLSFHGFAILQAGHAFDASADPDPDPQAILDGIARSLDLDRP